MAYYSHLHIYNTAFELLHELYLRIPKFSKQYKYLLGSEIIKSNLSVIKLIIEINNEKDLEKRQGLFKELIWSIESIIILIRIANELKQFGAEKGYLYIMERAVNLSKQAEGWKKI
ncbi:MAG TPA: hypothetical protein PKL13_03305 [bacterium]|nr:hypothetical protein [bacterium]